MKSFSLQAEKRTVTGRKVSALRKNGQLPATVYGRDVEPMTISLSTASFLSIAKEAGETGLIELAIAGKKIPVLIDSVQNDAVSHDILHVSFHQVNLKEKVKANVPIEFIGEPKAVTEKAGVLLTLLDEVEVEALPTQLPEKLVVDVSLLEKVGDEVTVGQLAIPEGVEVLVEKEVSLAHIASIVSKQAEETVAPVAPISAEPVAAESTTQESAGE